MIKNKNISHAKRLRWRGIALQNAICHYLGIDNKKYCQTMYQEGLYYISQIMLSTGATDAEIAHVERSAFFWGWWKIEWWNREEEFMVFVTANSTMYSAQLRCHWALIHSGSMMAKDGQLVPPDLRTDKTAGHAEEHD